MLLSLAKSARLYFLGGNPWWSSTCGNLSPTDAKLRRAIDLSSSRGDAAVKRRLECNNDMVYFFFNEAESRIAIWNQIRFLFSDVMIDCDGWWMWWMMSLRSHNLFPSRTSLRAKNIFQKSLWRAPMQTDTSHRTPHVQYQYEKWKKSEIAHHTPNTL